MSKEIKEKIEEVVEGQIETLKETDDYKNHKENKVNENNTKKPLVEDKSIEEKKEDTPKEEPKTFRKGGFSGKRRKFQGPTREEIIEAWDPKTKLGKDVKTGKIKDINQILDNNIKILEPEIVDSLLNIQSDLIFIGQSKGKFGGGKRRAWRQTQRKTKEGNVPTFSALAVVGDKNGHVGIGYGKSKETLPSRDKATKKAKLNIIYVTRGDGSFDSVGGGNKSIPFKIEGKSGSVKVIFMPAPPGTGLVAADELKKILKLVGIEDIYSKTFGKARTTFNLAKACIDALQKTNNEVNRQ